MTKSHGPAPRGYDKEHPSIELLRLKHFAALVMLPVDALLSLP